MNFPQYFPLQLLAACLLWNAGNIFAESSIGIAGDKSDGLYQSGQEAVFTITRTEATTTAATIQILLNNHEEVLSQPFPGSAMKQVVRFKPKSPGWYVCKVMSPEDDKKPVTQIGAIFNAKSLEPSSATPSDFDAFWKGQKARLIAEKAVPRLEPLSPEQLALEGKNPDQAKQIADLQAAGVTFSNLEIPCLDARPVQAYFARPPAARTKGHAAIIYLRAAGVDGDWCRASLLQATTMAKQFDALVVDMNAHGMANGQPEEYYTTLAKGELLDYGTQGRDSRDHFYFLGMFLRLQRAIDFLCRQPEWDGRHLLCVGTSQGGGQALAGAGLDARVSAVVAVIPAICDLTAPLVGRPSCWPGLNDWEMKGEKIQEKIATLRFFDNTNFCARSQAETLVAVGLVDTVCPSPSVLTAYNQLKKRKELDVFPSLGHSELSSPTQAMRERYDAFILAHTKN